MRIIISVLMLIFALSAGPAGAANYYVSTTGSNSNSGTSLANPYQTIQQAANVAVAGDNVYVRGGTYRETVTATQSGTASDPITFQPYLNEQVTITGLDQVGGYWSTYSGSTYSKQIYGGVSQVFVNGKMMSEARSANSGYINPFRRAVNTVDSATINALPTDSTITSASLGSPSNGTWNGAKMATASGLKWVTWTKPITQQTGNTVSFQWDSHVHYEPKAGNPFYLYDSLAAVDSDKEYYYDASSSKLYFNSSVDPNTQTVEVRKRALGFDLNYRDYINVSGFRLKAANVQINSGGNNNLIDNCQILYPTSFTDESGWNRTPGVRITGQNNTLSNSEVAYSWGSGVSLYGSSNTVSNNVIHDVNWYGNDAAAVDVSVTSDNTVANNTVYNTGRSGISHRGAASATITHNEVARYGFLTTDLGGIHTASTDGGGTVTAYNNIHDSMSNAVTAGVYHDSGCSNHTVHHNVISNTSSNYGIIVKGDNEDVYNNTLWNVPGSYAVLGLELTNSNTYNNLSNSSTFIGNSTGTNLYTTTDQFVNSGIGDYTLKSTSSAINAGTVIPGITDGYLGSKPDVGAFEYGATPWTAGASFKTWLFPNQTAAPLTTAVAVTATNIRTTAGPLIAGRTGSSASTSNRSFLKFNLSGVTDTIQSAVVRIYENTVPMLATGGVGLYTVRSSWNSGSVSYNQSAAYTGTAFYDPDNLDLYTDIDVTSIVQGWLDDPSSNFGFSFRSDAEGTNYSAKYFEGMYGVTAPQLILTVPEPGALFLLSSAALAGLGILAWRRRLPLSRTSERTASCNNLGHSESLHVRN